MNPPWDSSIDVDSDAYAIWHVYAGIFREMWGVSPMGSYCIGKYARPLGNLEFALHGERAYEVSWMLPIRNAYYRLAFSNSLRERLSDSSFKEPILDFGAG